MRVERVDRILFYGAHFILIFGRETHGGIGLFLLAILLLLFLKFFYTNITYAFLTCLIVISNPGGMFEGEPFGFDVRFLYLRDIFFYLSFSCIFSPQIRDRFKVDDRFKNIIPIILFFSLYQIVISVIYNLKIESLFSFFKLFENHKYFIIGIFVVFPAYKIVRVNPQLFFKSLFLLSVFYTSAFLISVFTDFKIVDFVTQNRVRGGAFVRNMIQNSELFKLTMYMSVCGILLKFAKENVSMYIAGVLSLAVLLVGMYRLELFYTIMTMILVMLLILRTYKVGMKKLANGAMYAMLLLLLLYLLLPAVGEGMYRAFMVTLKDMSGDGTRGASQTRTIIELPNQLHLIRNHPLLGVGFDARWWLNYHGSRDWGLSDIPIVSTAAKYGFLGMAIYYFRFVKLIKDFFKGSAFVASNSRILLTKYDIELFAFYAIGVYFFIMVTFRLFYIGWELTLNYLQLQFGAFIGMFYGLYREFEVFEVAPNRIKE